MILGRTWNDTPAAERDEVFKALKQSSRVLKKIVRCRPVVELAANMVKLGPAWRTGQTLNAKLLAASIDVHAGVSTVTLSLSCIC